ncbi:hypothetical protein GCM10028822_18410 [Hymenobacter terrigena]
MKMSKYLLVGLGVATLGLGACKKNFPDGGTYEEPTFLKISGPTQVAKNTSRTYATYYLDNGGYVWSFPADAVATTDQGKSQITVKFGVQSGKVTVKAKGMEASVDVVVQ